MPSFVRSTTPWSKIRALAVPVQIHAPSERRYLHGTLLWDGRTHLINDCTVWGVWFSPGIAHPIAHPLKIYTRNTDVAIPHTPIPPTHKINIREMNCHYQSFQKAFKKNIRVLCSESFEILFARFTTRKNKQGLLWPFPLLQFKKGSMLFKVWHISFVNNTHYGVI